MLVACTTRKESCFKRQRTAPPIQGNQCVFCPRLHAAERRKCALPHSPRLRNHVLLINRGIHPLALLIVPYATTSELIDRLLIKHNLLPVLRQRYLSPATTVSTLPSQLYKVVTHSKKVSFIFLALNLMSSALLGRSICASSSPASSALSSAYLTLSSQFSSMSVTR